MSKLAVFAALLTAVPLALTGCGDASYTYGGGLAIDAADADATNPDGITGSDALADTPWADTTPYEVDAYPDSQPHDVPDSHTDIQSDIADVKPDTGPDGFDGWCGDGLCDWNEDANSCPFDCTQTKNPMTCVNLNCGKAIQKCAMAPGCSKFLDCANGCPDNACILKCSESVPISGAMLTVLQCGADTGCISLTPTSCGNGKCEDGEQDTCPEDCYTGPMCGNGMCEYYETAATCPADCGVSDPMACASLNCPKDWEICKSQPVCGKVLECASQCQGSMDCIQMCAVEVGPEGLQQFMPLAQCAQAAGCVNGGTVCGDGLCDAGEEYSCPSDCPATDACGDGTCGPNESHDTCPSDCGPPGNPISCAKEVCPDQYMACINDKACGALLNCAVQCSSADCVQKCQDTWLQAAAQWFMPLGECASAKGCNGSVLCGNGTCDAGEQDTCPEDCGTLPTPCKTIQDCGAGEICCNTGADQICVPSGQCG